MPGESEKLDAKIDFRTTMELKKAAEDAAEGVEHTVGWLMNKLIIDHVIDKEKIEEQDLKNKDELQSPGFTLGKPVVEDDNESEE